jgi:hypothetical protein
VSRRLAWAFLHKNGHPLGNSFTEMGITVKLMARGLALSRLRDGSAEGDCPPRHFCLLTRWRRPELNRATSSSADLRSTAELSPPRVAS